MQRLSGDLSIYTVRNPYKYRYNVNHPKIYPLYIRYKQKLHQKGQLQGEILSDKERFNFERLIDIMLQNKK